MARSSDLAPLLLTRRLDDQSIRFVRALARSRTRSRRRAASARRADHARHDPRNRVRSAAADRPGATVVITDESTNVSREVQSDSEGLFEASNLRPGTYTVTASLSGFKKVQRTGV